MKKFLRIAAYISASLLLLAILTIFLFVPSMVFSRIPSAYSAVNMLTHKVGYEFVCFDLHGGWGCTFMSQALVDPVMAKKQQDEKLTDMVGCRSDTDCVVTPKGGCASKGWFSRGSPNDGKCICLTGPVVFGCVPKADSVMYQEQ